jgi:hypothetical protein
MTAKEIEAGARKLTRFLFDQGIGRNIGLNPLRLNRHQDLKNASQCELGVVSKNVVQEIRQGSLVG